MSVWVVVGEMKTAAGPCVWVEGVAKTKRGADIIIKAATDLHGDKIRLSATVHEVRSA